MAQESCSTGTLRDQRGKLETEGGRKRRLELLAICPTLLRILRCSGVTP
jgi:hypothetical protein